MSRVSLRERARIGTDAFACADDLATAVEAFTTISKSRDPGRHAEVAKIYARRGQAVECDSGSKCKKPARFLVWRKS